MDGASDVPLCDNEPIHIPGSIQPHGLMLVAARRGLLTWQVAGDVEHWLGISDWLGAPLASLIGTDLTARVIEYTEFEEHDGATPHVAFIGQLTSATGVRMDVSAHVAGLAGAVPPERDVVVVELEPAAADPLSAAMLLDRLEEAASAFARAGTLETMCRAAAFAVRRLNGFDRVLVYRFEDDDAGRVLAEDRRPGMHSFLNHRFPASDIPRQARALYVRNMMRVIPDIHYEPALLRPPAPGAPLDMTDSSLRSVSPIHLQYMFNMGMRASASFSIVKEGELWGLIACHNEAPRRIAYEIRMACRTVAAILSREVKVKEEAEGYRQRLRLRSFEDEMVRLLSREDALDEALSRHIHDLQRAMSADGVAVLRGRELATGGVCPPREALRALTAWLLASGTGPVRATEQLSELYAPALQFREAGSGLLSVVVSDEEPWLVLWFRGEQIETTNWAGNPHKPPDLGTDGRLSPRNSFEDWAETVRGRSVRWAQPELEAASRLRGALLDVRHHRQLLELNRQLTNILQVKDTLLQQKEFLIGEVNHRVQNSLQLVSSFLSLQAREAGEGALRGALDEAGRRMTAVSLVHRRLYGGDQVEMIDAGRYIEELCNDMLVAMGPEWRRSLRMDLTPVVLSTEQAVPMGLVLTELIINARKYAYDGGAGPLEIQLQEGRGRFVLVVADHGAGRASSREGFGSRMIAALVQQLGAELDYGDNKPGLRAVLTVPQR